MSHPRIEALNAPYTDTVQDAFDKIMPAGMDPLIIFRTYAHNPPILRKQMALGATLLTSKELPSRDRELVILRTCAVCGSEYEWGVHVTAYARPLQFSEEEIEGTVTASADDPRWDTRQSLLLRLVDELHATAHVSDELWEALTELWEAPQLLQLLTLCGMYHAVSFTTNATQMQLEETGARFPEVAEAR